MYEILARPRPVHPLDFGKWLRLRGKFGTFPSLMLLSLPFCLLSAPASRFDHSGRG
jgi:hypothetical protein